MKTPGFTRLFGNRPRAVIGMIHVRALPGTPCYANDMEAIIDQALGEADTCLLYTTDAADDLLCVDLGGRRISKKKNKQATYATHTTADRINRLLS